MGEREWDGGTASLDAAEPMIKISGLKKVFPTPAGEITVLDGIDLQVEQGEIFGIIGMSGAGKSTLIRCLNLLETPTDGELIIDGVNVARLRGQALYEYRRSTGMIFQQFNLLMQKTVLKNVCFPMEIAKVPGAEAKRRAMELLELVGIADKVDSYPSQLSGGQRQRVAIARALSTSPKILLCDEPTSALDPSTTRSILSLLADINRKLGITIVIITHEMSVIEQICTGVAVIDAGRIAESGKTREVFSNPRTRSAKQLVFPGGKEGLSQVSGRHCCRIVFDGQGIYEPVLSDAVLKFGAPVNILFADIKQIGENTAGSMIVELPPDKEKARQVVEYLRSCSLAVEEVNADV